MFKYFRAYTDFPKHDAVDQAAKQATSFPEITDFARLPVSDLKNLYRSFIL